MAHFNDCVTLIRLVPASPAPLRRPARRLTVRAAVTSFLLGAVVLGALGCLAGHGAAERWIVTRPVERASWGESPTAFIHSLFIASWSAEPVRHGLQDVTVPLRVLVV